MSKFLLSQCKPLSLEREDVLVHPSLGIMKTLFSGDPGELVQEYQYGTLANTLNHPWIVRTLGFFWSHEDTGAAAFVDENGRLRVIGPHFIGMPYLNLQKVENAISLRSFTHDADAIPPDSTFYRVVAIQVLATLELLRNRCRLWHNDPHGENILCKILDTPETIVVDLPTENCRFSVQSCIRPILIDFGRSTRLTPEGTIETSLIDPDDSLHADTYSTIEDALLENSQEILAFEFQSHFPSHFFLGKTFAKSILQLASSPSLRQPGNSTQVLIECLE